MISERRRIHVIGGGPVGLMLTALLQTTGGFSVRLYEKRTEYTRTRMVKLDPYLVADSVESYCIDHIDEENIGALFDQTELEEGVAFRRSISSELMTLLRNWTLGFCPLNDIERALSDLINRSDSHSVERVAAAITLPEITAMLAPGNVVIDCTGSHSLLRDQLASAPQAALQDANIFKIRLEYALIVTFLYSQKYVCDEYCKYYKNAENDRYK